MPSSPSDLATVIAGGNPHQSNALLKGAFSGSNCAKSAIGDHGSASSSNFADLLDEPASEASAPATSVTDDSSSALFPQVSSENSPSPTTVLQIKGMNSVLVVPEVAPAVEPAVVADSSVAPTVETIDDSLTDEVVPAPTDPVVAGPVENTDSPGIPAEPAKSGRARGKGMKFGFHFGRFRRGENSLPHVGANSRLNGKVLAPEHSGPCLPVVELPTSLSPLARAAVFGNGGLGHFCFPFHPLVDTVIPNLPVEGDLPAAESTSTETVEVAADSASSGEIGTVVPDASLAGTVPVLDQEEFNIPVALQPTPELGAQALQPKPAEVISTEEAGASETEATVTPELRHHLVETVAALLTPLWHSLPLETHGTESPVLSTNENTDSVSAETEPAPSPTVTIKIGEEPPVVFELPRDSLAASEAASESAQPVVETESSVETAIPLPGETILPEDTEVPVMDFRVQLKAGIEAAWMQAEESADTASSAATLPTEEVEPKSTLVHPVMAHGVENGDSNHPVMPSILRDVLPYKFTQPASQVQEPVVADKNPAARVEVAVDLPGLGSLTAVITSDDPAINPLVKNTGSRFGRTEKNAGDWRFAGPERNAKNSAAEKTFLNTAGELLNSKSSNAGTAVAKSGDSMPATFTSPRLAVDPLEFPSKSNGREILPLVNGTQNFMDAAETPVAVTPAPVLAHRAVETIQNVVDAQRQSAANASSVNLHFKFGGDDLAVKVQMRDGEVLTQFITDSVELRSALSSEWQIMAGQGGVSGIRWHDPVIVPASQGSSSGFGSANQGQNQAQQQQANQQQQAHAAAAAFPELRGLRRGISVKAPSAETTPRASSALPTSQHLTAVA